MKDELAGLVPARPCCQMSELLGIFYASRGRLVEARPGQAAYFSLLKNTVARKVVRLGRSIARMEARYRAVKSSKRTAFLIELPLPTGMEGAFARSAARSLPEATCDRKAFLRGFFLGCGSVNAPSARYHMEFVVPTLGWATAVLRLAHEMAARAGMMEREGHHVVYVKEGDSIVRLLSLMGASRAVMEFENARVVREVRGQVNRRLNFETANIDKTIGSALRQVEAIVSLDRAGAMERLSPALREMARRRRENPELNLAELAGRMGLTKSAVNHRLRRLVELSQDAHEHQKTSAGGRSA
ncbi:MAG: DNA-binding protein WhiA [Candidatus Dormibacterales bacterium]